MERLSRARRVRALYRCWPAAGVVAALGLSPAAQADDIADLQREMKDMQRHYDAELKRLQSSYEARLRRLEAKLKQAETKPSAAPKQEASTISSAAPPQPLADPPQGQLPNSYPALAPAAATEPAPAVAPGGAAAQAGSFNPAIGIVLQGKASYFGKNPDSYFVRGFPLGDEAGPGRRGLSLGESEINFQANADPYLFGNLTLSIDPDNHVSIEEAFIQSTSLPGGLTLRAGRFFSGIGYLNEQHSHTWDFADQALPYRVFLNTQYDDDGVQLRWLAPTTQFLELGGEVFRGTAFPAGGPAHVGFGTFNLFAHTGGDIDDSSSYRTGLSWLHTNAHNRTTSVSNAPDDTFTGHSETLIYDTVFKWAPNGNPVEQNLKLQGELFAHYDDGKFNLVPLAGWSTGFYVQAAYQFMPRWRVGARYDQVLGNRQSGPLAGSTVDNLGTTARRASAMLEYNTSEFGRFRLQYNRDWSRGAPDDQAILQYVISLGAHGAHLF